MFKETLKCPYIILQNTLYTFKRHKNNSCSNEQNTGRSTKMKHWLKWPEQGNSILPRVHVPMVHNHSRKI